MSKLRSLSGQDVVKIFEQFGFVVIRIRGSHHVMRRAIEGQTQTINVPVHGKQSVAKRTLRTIHRDACRFIPEEELRPHFYTD